MNLKKENRLYLMVVLFAILLVLPFIGAFYYKTLYYSFLFFALLLVISLEIIKWPEKQEKKFYSKWPEKRKRGFWVNIFQDSLTSFLIMMVIIPIGPFFANGHTPLDTINKLSPTFISGILIFLILTSLLAGVLNWYEKERKFERIRNNIGFTGPKEDKDN